MYCLKLSAMLVVAVICQETLGSDKWWAGRGCNKGNVKQVLKPKSSKFPVRCCSKVGTLTCDLMDDEKCYQKDKTTHREAEEQCNNKELRLCTKAELAKKICCESGVRCKNHLTWSSTSDCKTDDDKKRTCVFPFKYDGIEYHKCTNVDYIKLPGKTWCGLKYDVKERSDWAECKEKCSGSALQYV